MRRGAPVCFGSSRRSSTGANESVLAVVAGPAPSVGCADISPAACAARESGVGAIPALPRRSRGRCRSAAQAEGARPHQPPSTQCTHEAPR
jgi:hypothetical protein